MSRFPPVSVFEVGQRVVVAETYSGAGCNHDMRGCYGHIVAEPYSMHNQTPFFLVALTGHINGKPVHPDRRADRFPLYKFEMEHAD